MAYSVLKSNKFPLKTSELFLKIEPERISDKRTKKFSATEADWTAGLAKVFESRPPLILHVGHDRTRRNC